MQDALLQEAYWTRRIYWNVQVNYRVVSQSSVNQFLGFHTIGVIDGSDVKNGIVVVVTDPLFYPSISHFNSDYLQLLLQYLQRVFFLSIFTVVRNVLYIYKCYRLFPWPDTHSGEPW